MKPYRIKHKKSGLYYQPACNYTNLSKKGKVYLNNVSPMTQNTYDGLIPIQIRQSTKVYKIVKDIFNFIDNKEEYYAHYIQVPKSEFEIEEL